MLSPVSKPLQMWPPNSLGYTMPEHTDWKWLFTNAETEQTNCTSNRKQNKENCEILLKRFFSEGHKNVTSELNTKGCCSGKAGGCPGNALRSASTETSSCVTVSKLNTEVCIPTTTGGGSVDVHQSADTETSSSDSVLAQHSMQTLPLAGHNQRMTVSSHPCMQTLPLAGHNQRMTVSSQPSMQTLPLAGHNQSMTVSSQPSMQTLPLDGHNQSMTVSSHPSMQTLPLDGHNQSMTESPQAIATTSSYSFGNPTPTTSLYTATEQQMSGHNGNRSTGARPKLTASRKSKKNSQSKNKRKHVTRSEEKKYVTLVYHQSYDHYRNCILNLPLPNNSRAHAAAVEAVMFMCGRDEPISLSLINIALKFLWVKLGFCPKAVALYTTICEFKYDERSLVLAFLELCQREPSLTVANELFGNIQTIMSGPVNTNRASQNGIDTTDNISLQTTSSQPEQNNVSHSLADDKSVINSGQQGAQVLKEEPLKVLEFHAPESIVSHSQDNQQQPCEANNSAPHTHHPVTQPPYPDSHNHPSVSHIHHPVSLTSHSHSITDSEDSRKQQQQRLPVSEEQMQSLQIKVLKREQEHLRNALTCVLCKSKPVEVTLLPCGHFVLCAACSDECNFCPVCNKEALAEVKTFLC